MNSEMVIESVMLMIENFVDIPVQNDDVYEDEPPDNNSSLLGGEYEVPSPLYKELNWDVINAMSDETLTSRDGLWNESNELYEGLRFENKADFQYVVKRYSIHRNQHFFVCESNPNLWTVKCKKSTDGCKWRLRACRRKTHCMFEITKYISPHTCVYPKLSQDHSQLDLTLIARQIQSIVKRDPTTSIATLHQIVKDKFGYDVHYMRVWETRRKAVAKVFGDWDESYHILPKWLNILQLTNLGTKVVWKTLTFAYAHGNVRFMRVFWAFGASIEGFKSCRPLIQIDGTFLYGKYKRKLLIATSVDPNRHIFPLAFAIVEEESIDS